ncbi:hypothetical protein RSOL_034130 [Rhizoctonia solani AG-3 Rhs1AP]|uniref:Fungal-type protein kinase domain-containing protein n=2 Tax=Rhizoctonia solani AG-3 TaxID=1086053 RepID=A0A074REP1_9AGAM|nr:hypothetical protein RSOL_034130 [Rhizoctonia solani AG-3 Rhs1AP]KEP45601.1 hypothetical protein V565_256610 [Rhizoctonia solani 123E]
MQAPLHAPCLKGRSTVGFGVTNASDEANTLDESRTPFVTKLYWPRRDRPKEEETIERARGVAKYLPDHLAFVVGSCDIDPLGTLCIKRELGTDTNSPSPPRARRMIIFERLIPITDLGGDTFLVALVQIMRCHFVLWNHGLGHQDISLANLMARFKDGCYYGVLNDWDLARTDADYPRKDLTGTMPFVALRLLTVHVGSINPGVKRLYYHELESFFWIMIWVFLAYQDKKLQLTRNADRWQTGDPMRSLEVRNVFLAFQGLYRPNEEWKSYWEMSIAATRWVFSRCWDLNQEETVEGNLKSLQSFLEIVGQALMDQMPTTPLINVV